jgi:hypothetical protein
MVYGVYEQEPDLLRVVHDGGERQEFREYMALLATGLSDPEDVFAVVTSAAEGRRRDQDYLPPANDSYTHARDLLSEATEINVASGIVNALRDHRLTAAEAVSELELLHSFSRDLEGKPSIVGDSGFVVLNEYGLELRTGYGGEPEIDIEELERDFEIPKLESEIAQSLGLTASATQRELVPSEDNYGYTLNSKLQHTSLGHLVDGEYQAMVTVLAPEHHVRGLAQGKLRRGEI